MRSLFHRSAPRNARHRRHRLSPALPTLLVLVPTVLVASLAVDDRVGGHTAAAYVAQVGPAVHRALPSQRPFTERPMAVLPPAPKPRPKAAPRAARSAHRVPLHQWVRPYGGSFTSGFGYRWGRLHKGVDLAGPYGSPIVAATDGEIVYAGPESGYGTLIVIRDWDGTETAYGHMSGYARTSGYVHAGDVIAYVGAAGDATGPHLHFEVRIGGEPIDPVPFLATRGVDL